MVEMDLPDIDLEGRVANMTAGSCTAATFRALPQNRSPN